MLRSAPGTTQKLNRLERRKKIETTTGIEKFARLDLVKEAS
jgi:hypothetical protein